MKKNVMLFKWFLMFAVKRHTDEYDIHDYIRDRFCPEYFPAEEFDDREQLLRDSPGPANIKYAWFTGVKVNGLSGGISAVSAIFFPTLLAAAAVIFLLRVWSGSNDSTVDNVFKVMFEGIFATTLGLVAAHVYKIVYFNKVNKGSLTIILPFAAICILLPDILFSLKIVPERYISPVFYVLGIIILGTAIGFIYDKVHKYNIKIIRSGKKQIDPYSKKAIRERDRKLREEEEELRRGKK